MTRTGIGATWGSAHACARAWPAERMLRVACWEVQRIWITAGPAPHPMQRTRGKWMRRTKPDGPAGLNEAGEAVMAHVIDGMRNRAGVVDDQNNTVG